MSPEVRATGALAIQDAGQAAQLLSIDLLDHVIIGDGRFVSLKEQGAM
ncbi:MAG: JAB domain-containing protein [Dehalococcoidia bacterium]|nr:JAB domain-containing protein [Dehalococcoidia bacterium]